MALPMMYDAVDPAATRRPTARKKWLRMLSVISFFAAVAGLVALAGQSTEQSAALLTVNSKHPLNALALQFLRSGESMTLQDMQSAVQEFSHNPQAEPSFPARTVMLVGFDKVSEKKAHHAYPWSAHVDKASGQTYYWNRITHESKWNEPRGFWQQRETARHTENLVVVFNTSEAANASWPSGAAAGRRTQYLDGESPQPPADGGGGDRSESMLCKKKDIIIQKLDQLLKKLGGEELSANITMGKVSKEWKEAMESWLSSESTYRLQVEKTKDAMEGEKFAEDEYEKWKVTNKKAKAAYEEALKRHEQQRKDLADERELIRMIMRYIGVLSDVKATEKSIAAGGRDSVIDPTTGVSDPYNMKLSKKAQLSLPARTMMLAGEKTAQAAKEALDELRQKVAELKAVVLKTKVAGQMHKLALIEKHLPTTTKLPVYSETVEVAQILKEMLGDLDMRLKIIDSSDEEMKKLVDDTWEKVVEWEKKLVALGKETDEAERRTLAQKSQREQLNGDKVVAQKNYDETEAEMKLTIPPYEREIYVITMIKVKINDYCDPRLAAAEQEFNMLDKNGDGALSQDEYEAGFHVFDTNNDKYITREEYDNVAKAAYDKMLNKRSA